MHAKCICECQLEKKLENEEGEKTQATFIVWRDGKLHHLHDKSFEKFEIWQKGDNIYWDNDYNLYSRITSGEDNLTELFVDSKGKEYKFKIG